MEKVCFILFSALAFLYWPCHSDTNLNTAQSCLKEGESTTGSSFQDNLVIVLDSLSTNGPTHNGFYTETAGQGKSNVFGLVQCRGDVSSADCYNCIQECIKSASYNCSASKNVAIWFTWCFLRYSSEDFFGVWDQFSAAVYNDSDFDDPWMGFKGINFMSQLASSAPMTPLMFQTGVLEAGENEKRYGMAQCIRDINKEECRKCLNAALVTFRTSIGNKRGWEIYGSSCSMWYHDSRFYFNVSIPVHNDAKRSLLDGPAIVIAMAVLTFFS